MLSCGVGMAAARFRLLASCFLFIHKKERKQEELVLKKMGAMSFKEEESIQLSGWSCERRQEER